MASEYLKRAQELLRSSPLIDGHNDFPYMLRGWYANDFSSTSFDPVHMPIGQTDLKRLSAGMVGGQFWSAYVPDNTDNLQALLATLQQIDAIHQLVTAAPTVLGMATKAADVWPLFQTGRVASWIGIEGLHQTGGSASVLRLLHRLGVRYATLCHGRNNDYVDSATDSPRHNGLSSEGRAMVREMQRIGIMVDLSHTSHDAQRQTLQIAAAPVLFSHSSCYALCGHPRNVPDDVLDALRTNGGVVMICFLPSLSKTDEGKCPASVSTVAEHILYAGTRIGFEHVGIGSDFDGMLEGPLGLDDVSRYPHLVAELLARGVSEADVRGVMGLNVLRVLSAVEEYAAEKQKNQMNQEKEHNLGVLCDRLEPVWTEEQRAILTKKGKERAAAASSE